MGSRIGGGRRLPSARLSREMPAVTAAFVVAICIPVLIIMSICIPRFRRVQKATDKINRVARENLTGINVVHAFNAEDY